MPLSKQQSTQLRRRFFIAFADQLRVVWPIISGILLVMVGSGLVIWRIEGWRIDEALYFTFVTGTHDRLWRLFAHASLGAVAGIGDRFLGDCADWPRCSRQRAGPECDGRRQLGIDGRRGVSLRTGHGSGLRELSATSKAVRLRGGALGHALAERTFSVRYAAY